MIVPDETIDQAAETYFLASEREMGFTDSAWSGDNGATEETRQQFRWAASRLAPVIAEWARREALEDASARLFSQGDAREKKARAEQARGRAEASHGELRRSQLAHDHAWALRNQADGLLEAAAAVRAWASGDDKTEGQGR